MKNNKANAREEIDKYMELWDQAQKHFPKEKKPAPSKNSYFGMSNIPEDVDEFAPNEEEHWRDVYYRSLEIDPDEVNGGDQLVNEDDINQQYLAGMMDIHEVREAKKKAAEAKSSKKKSKTSKKKTVDKRKPQEDDAPDWDEDKDGFGKDLAKKLGDAEFSPNPVHFSSIGDDNALRVTPNFTDGDDLRQLARLKSLLYDLESELLGTDIRGGKTEPVRAKMIAVRRQCEALSQRLIPDPRKDVS